MAFNSFLNFFKLDEDDGDGMGFEEEMYEEQPREPEPRRRPAPPQREQREPVVEEQPRRAGFRGTGGGKSSRVTQMKPSMQVSIIAPTSFEDSQSICNRLLSGRPVVVNLDGFDPDDAQRVMDFISGCIYAINGKYHQISKYIFIFTPENVDINVDSIVMDGNTVTMPTLDRDF